MFIQIDGFGLKFNLTIIGKLFADLQWQLGIIDNKVSIDDLGTQCIRYWID